MTAKLLSLTLFSVMLSAVAQIALKAGMSAPQVLRAIAGDDYIEKIVVVATSPFVITGLGLYVLGALVWLSVLAKVDVSLAYPFVGLGFLITAGFAALFLGETITLPRLIGTGMIAAGIVLVAHG